MRSGEVFPATVVVTAVAVAVAVTVRAYGRRGSLCGRKGAHAAQMIVSDRAGADPDRAGGGTNATDPGDLRALGQIAPTIAIQYGRGARTISRIIMQAGVPRGATAILKYINNNARLNIQ